MSEPLNQNLPPVHQQIDRSPPKNSGNSSLAIKVTKIFFLTLALGGASVAVLACIQYLPAYAFWGGGASFVVSSVILTSLFLRSNKTNKTSPKNSLPKDTPPPVNNSTTKVLDIEEETKRKDAVLRQVAEKQVVLRAITNKELKATKKNWETENQIIKTKGQLKGSIFNSFQEKSHDIGILHIFSFIHYGELSKFARVNKAWKEWIYYGYSIWAPKIQQQYKTFPRLDLAQSREDSEGLPLSRETYLRTSQIELPLKFSATAAKVKVVLEKVKIELDVLHIKINGSQLFLRSNDKMSYGTLDSITKTIDLPSNHSITQFIPYNDHSIIFGNGDSLLVTEIATWISQTHSKLNEEILDCCAMSKTSFILARESHFEYWTSLDDQNPKILNFDQELIELKIYKYFDAIITDRNIKTSPSIITIETNETINHSITTLNKWNFNSNSKEFLTLKTSYKFPTNPSHLTLLGGSYMVFADKQRNLKLLNIDSDEKEETVILKTNRGGFTIDSILWLTGKYVAISHSERKFKTGLFNLDMTEEFGITIIDLGQEFSPGVDSLPSNIIVKTFKVDRKINKLVAGDESKFFGVSGSSLYSYTTEIRKNTIFFYPE